jgi:hypothetical protein
MLNRVEVGGIGRLRTWLDRVPVYGESKADWRYIPVSHRAPTGSADMANLVRMQLTELRLRPGHINWETTMPYTGAVYAAIKEVDREEVMDTYPKGPSGLNIDYVHRLSWPGQLFKTALAFSFMLTGTKILDEVIVGVPLEFHRAFIYLALNAARNVVADLSAKHGFSNWPSYLHHVKWDKMTDSLLVTSFAYFILSSLIENLSPYLGGVSGNLWIAGAVTTIDGVLQVGSRLWRGFPKEVAKHDFFRPLVGDLIALSICLAVGIPISAQVFTYLVMRKVFCETWSGNLEARAKRLEKVTDRYRNLEAVLRLEEYKVPDAEAMAAINLAYLAEEKSLSDQVIREIISNNYMGMVRKRGFIERFGSIRGRRIWHALISSGYVDRHGIIHPAFKKGGEFNVQRITLNDYERESVLMMMEDGISFAQDDLSPILAQIKAAMEDDTRIEQTIEFLFQGECPEYAAEMKKQFRNNRVSLHQSGGLNAAAALPT